MTRHSSSSQEEAEQHDANPGFWPLCSTARPPLPPLFCGGNARARPRGGPGWRRNTAGRPAPLWSPGPRTASAAAAAPSPAPAAAGRHGLRRAGPAPGRCERRSAPAGRGRTAPTRGAAAVAVAAGEVTSCRCAEPPPPGWEKRVSPRSALRSEVRQPPVPPPVLPAPPPAQPRCGAAAGPRCGHSPWARVLSPRGRAARGRGGTCARPAPRAGAAAAVPPVPGEPGGRGGPRLLLLPARGAAAAARPAAPGAAVPPAAAAKGAGRRPEPLRVPAAPAARLPFASLGEPPRRGTGREAAGAAAGPSCLVQRWFMVLLSQHLARRASGESGERES